MTTRPESPPAQCVCRGECGTTHLNTQRQPDQCPRVDGQYVKGLGRQHLITAPTDPAAPFRSGVPLMAWCRTCYDTGRRNAKRTERTTPPQDDGLFT